MFNTRKSDIQAKGRKPNRQTKTLIIFLDKDVTWFIYLRCLLYDYADLAPRRLWGSLCLHCPGMLSEGHTGKTVMAALYLLLCPLLPTFKLCRFHKANVPGFLCLQAFQFSHGSAFGVSNEFYPLFHHNNTACLFPQLDHIEDPPESVLHAKAPSLFVTNFETCRPCEVLSLEITGNSRLWTELVKGSPTHEKASWEPGVSGKICQMIM